MNKPAILTAIVCTISLVGLALVFSNLKPTPRSDWDTAVDTVIVYDTIVIEKKAAKPTDVDVWEGPVPTITKYKISDWVCAWENGQEW